MASSRRRVPPHAQFKRSTCATPPAAVISDRGGVTPARHRSAIGVETDASSNAPRVSAARRPCWRSRAGGSTALVEPAVAWRPRAVLRNASGVIITSRGRRFARKRIERESPQRRAASSLVTGRGNVVETERAIRPAVNTIAIVFRGELSAAGTGAGTAVRRPRDARRRLAGAVRADRLEHLLHCDRAAVDMISAMLPPWLVATPGCSAEIAPSLPPGWSCRSRTARPHGVERMAVDGQLDRIGDDFAADQRRAHPRQPIAMPSVTAIVLNSIGVLPAARTPSYGRGSEIAQVEIARRDVDQVCTIATWRNCVSPRRRGRSRQHRSAPARDPGRFFRR